MLIATIDEITAAINHYKEVRERYPGDDLSEDYLRAIGNVPNYHISEDGSVVVFGEGGVRLPVKVVLDAPAAEE